MDTHKPFALALILIIAVLSISVFMAKPANAQLIPKPSTPQFTMEYLVQPYYIPPTTPTYTIDPYTGQQKVLASGSPSYSGDNKTIELKIKNQPFSPYTDSKGNYVSLFYNVSYKGHFENDWKTYYNYDSAPGFYQSDSEYTTVVFTSPPNEGQIDFRVEAQIGYYYVYHMPWNAYGFVGQYGDWSNIQTISIPDGKVTFTTSTDSTPSPTPSPSVPEFSALVLTPLLAAVLFVAIALKAKSKKVDGI